MMNVVAFDASFLLPVFSQKLDDVPKNPSTGKPIEKYYERIEGLLSQLEEAKIKILIPSPALSEILVRVKAEQVNQYLEMISSRSVFRVASFKQDAAIKVAEMSRKAIEQGDKRSGSTEVWNKVKFDRQIIALAKVNGAKIIYSDDRSLRKFTEQVDLKVIASHELEFQSQLLF